MNRVLLTGRLTRDPELRSLASGKTVTQFSLATNDYRAGQTCDLADDEADRAAGHKIVCPTLVLWGNEGIPAQNVGVVDTADPVATWRQWCDRVEGHGIDSGHFVAEENPQAMLSHLLPFLDKHAH